jgi:transcriptional regulator GlxA family with amidase domain
MSRGARRVVIVVFDGVQALDLVGPFEVFAGAGRMRPPGYRLTIAAMTPGHVATESGLGVIADAALASVRGPIDTLVVAGGSGVYAAAADPMLLHAVTSLAARSRRVASVCSGAFVLAAAGLLDGRRVATHWSRCERLAREYPTVTVDPDSVFVRDGDVWTSAGVTAGMDLALAMVADDHGREVALEIARWLVLYVVRHGGQTQFSAQLAGQLAQRQPLRELQAWIADHLAADLSVPVLARRAGMSPRNFARAFAREVGTTPGAFVERLRIETARRLVETGDESLPGVAAACGYRSTETFHRSFVRLVGTTPAMYRKHFRAEWP